MTDDQIDIEEHDVMDDPMLRKIFPDLSIIKKEISQYEGLEVKSEPTPDEFSLCKRNEIVVTSDSTIKGGELEVADCNNYRHIHDDQYFHSNIIILGSKPNSSNKQESKPKLPTVLLQNVSSYLKTSKTYCEICSILYPNVNALQLHNNLHSRNVNVKSEKNIKKCLVSVKSLKKKYKCDLCTIHISTQSNLIRHLKNVHQERRDVNKNKRLRRVKEAEIHVESHDTKSNSPTNILDQSHKCFHCQQKFLTQSLLIEHLYGVLEPKKNTTKLEYKDSESGFTSEKSPKDQVSGDDTNKVSDIIKSRRKLYQPGPSGGKKAKFDTEETGGNIIMEKKKITRASVKGSKLSVHHMKVDVTRIDNLDKRGKTPDSLLYHSKNTDIIKHSTNHTEKSNENLKHPSALIPKDIGDNKIITESNNKINTEKDNLTKALVESAYQCPLCSYYVTTYKKYIRHMAKNHKKKKIPRIQKVVYDSQCLYCTSKLVNIASYNNHLLHSHQQKLTMNYRETPNNGKDLKQENKILYETFKEKTFAFESVLYKCGKCDVHFLTAKKALNHSEHMEILVNWKCLICNRIFKKIDEYLHVKQHSCSHEFTVYQLDEITYNRVLYNCPKCAVHFTETNYIDHHSRCGKETPNSEYCKVCDILVNKNDYNPHKQIHTKDNLKSLDFTIVETNFILYDEDINHKHENYSIDSNKKVSTEVVNDNSSFKMTFCHICKCFLTSFASTLKAHVEARCTHIVKHVCTKCGLVFTNKSTQLHKDLHRKVKGLTIQNYFFYDFKSKKQICPPIPKYPSCEICEIHFITKREVMCHECSGCGFVLCQICQLKFTEKALKLHILFHQYSIENIQAPIESKKGNLKSIVNTPTGTTILHNATDTSLESQLPEFIYTCKSCQITFNRYDNVVRHCQSHYDHTKHVIDTYTCQYCTTGSRIDKNCCQIHKEMHARLKRLHKSVKVLYFDPIYFPLENYLWIKHIYGSVSPDDINNVLNESIYKFECRIKMEVLQNGLSDPTLYRCDKCRAFVDTKCLYSHSENKRCNLLQKHTCSKCGICFISFKHKTLHEVIHNNKNISIKSYKVVQFNLNKDQSYHNVMFKSLKNFILYQCRNCNAITDKFQLKIHVCHSNKLLKCIDCGLLFNKEEYTLHNTRHEELDNFNSAHIIVVLFGKDLGATKKTKPSYNGVICDYTFYKCKQCQLCLRTKECTFRHKCDADDSKYECTKCNLYFLKHESASHAILHETDPEVIDYLNIIQFNVHPNVKDTHEILVKPDRKDEDVIKDKRYSESLNTKLTRKRVNLYKCDCGLHFLDESNLKNHFDYCIPKMKISKQNCSKCGLLFTPEELFNHLLTHHADKKQVYSFQIICLSKHSNLSKIFKCEKCAVCLLKENEVNDHVSECDNSGSSRNHIKCRKCSFKICASSFSRNNHEDNCLGNYILQIINDTDKRPLEPDHKTIDTFITEQDRVYASECDFSREILSKLDLSKYSNVLYKCSTCNVHYLTESTWITHLRTCDKQKYTSILDICNICGLQFCLPSLTKHKYIHHEKFDLKKDEFVIKSSDDNKDFDPSL